MNTIKNELNIRKEEVKNFIDFEKDLESYKIDFKGSEGKHKTKSSGMMTIRTDIKSSIMIMLYNVIEATMTNILRYIHSQIQQSDSKFNQLNEELQKLFISYYLKSIEKTSRKSDSWREFIMMFNEKNSIQLSYEELIKFNPLYSGNLDSKEINSILCKYGVDRVRGKEELQDIKNKRNQLAHGELSFAEVGREVSVERLEILFRTTFDFLEDVINNVKTYIEEKKYVN